MGKLHLGKTAEQFQPFKMHMLPDLAASENVQDLGHDFLGHRFGWGPHRFAYLSHPCRGSGPFLINLLALNSDGGSDRFV